MRCAAADDAGALDVLVSVFTGPPGPKPEPLLQSTEMSVLILWGDTDGLTPIDVCPPPQRMPSKACARCHDLWGRVPVKRRAGAREFA